MMFLFSSSSASSIVPRKPSGSSGKVRQLLIPSGLTRATSSVLEQVGSKLLHHRTSKFVSPFGKQEAPLKAQSTMNLEAPVVFAAAWENAEPRLLGHQPVRSQPMNVSNEPCELISLLNNSRVLRKGGPDTE